MKTPSFGNNSGPDDQYAVFKVWSYDNLKIYSHLKEEKRNFKIILKHFKLKLLIKHKILLRKLIILHLIKRKKLMKW